MELVILNISVLTYLVLVRELELDVIFIYYLLIYIFYLSSF
jgi:hypothetical protein